MSYTPHDAEIASGEDYPAGDVISAALPNNHVPPKHQKALPHAEVAPRIARVRRSWG